MTDPVPGWYPDPSGGDGHRWWDGQRWSDTTRPAVAPAAAPPSSPPTTVPVGAPWATPGSTPPTAAPSWEPGRLGVAGPPVGPGYVGPGYVGPGPGSTEPPHRSNRRLVVGLVAIGLVVVVAVAAVAVGLHHGSSQADRATTSTTAGPASGSSDNSANPPSSVPSSTVPTAQLAHAAQQYAAAAATVNAAQRTFAAGTESLPADPTDDQVAALAAPYAQALDDFDQRLLDLDLPDSIATDRDDLVASNGVLRDDLLAVTGLGVGELDSWARSFTDDLESAAQDAAHLRVDLGLPPNQVGQGTTI